MNLNSIKVFTYVYVVGMLSMALLIIRWPFYHIRSSIAQLVEQVTVNHPVPGSSPGGGVS